MFKFLCGGFKSEANRSTRRAPETTLRLSTAKSQMMKVPLFISDVAFRKPIALFVLQRRSSRQKKDDHINPTGVRVVLKWNRTPAGCWIRWYDSIDQSPLIATLVRDTKKALQKRHDVWGIMVNKKVGQCALCREETELELSHIIPKMVVKELKKRQLATSEIQMNLIWSSKTARNITCFAVNANASLVRLRHTLLISFFIHIWRMNQRSSIMMTNCFIF